MSVVYDIGVLVVADRNNRRIWADHRVLLESGVLPTTTAPVIAQASRSPKQVQLRRFLCGCRIEAFVPEQAHEIGSLLARSGTADVVDAHVMHVAAARRAEVRTTSDPDDLNRLNDQLPTPVVIRAI